MRTTSTLLTASAVCAVAIALAPATRAQANRENRGSDDQRTSGKADDNKGSMETQTLHGIVSAITAEGEIALDYKNKRAVEVEAAFMTVVATPVRHDKGGEAEHKENASGSQQHGSAGRHRYNVYQVWISPKTKVCECTADMSNHAQGHATSPGDKKECSLDQLEVGDHVQIEFVSQRDESESKIAHQTEKMREKHGRHRMHIGYAKEISIMVPKDEDRKDDSRSRDGDAQNSSSDKK